MRKALTHLKKSDPLLAAVLDRVGPYKMAYHEPCFAAMARSIVFQQLNGRVATTIHNRFQEGCGGTVTAESILRLRPAKMRSLGLSMQKTGYLRDLARRTRDGELDFASLPALDDEEVIRRLTMVKGIGVWTAHMFLMFALRRPDILPTGDFGVRSAMKKLYGFDELPKPADMERIAEPWRPWRSVASWYLWRSLEGPVLL